MSTIIAEYWKHVVETQSEAHATKIRLALRRLRRLYGSLPASQFTPKKLHCVRQTWIDARLARSTVNDRTTFIKTMFRWAVEHEMVPATTWKALDSVANLRRGKSRAKEPTPVRPAPRPHIRKARARMTGPLRALVDLQLLTAARGGELFNLRAVDIDTSKPVWEYRPSSHKTSRHGCERVIWFGPRAKRVLSILMRDRPLTATLFSPLDSIAERAAQASTHRRPNQKPNPRKTDRVIRNAYDKDSYRQAIHRACRAAGVPNFNPHELRHTAVTALRREYGLELAQLVAGHQVGSRITELYAEANRAKAAEVMARVG